MKFKQKSFGSKVKVSLFTLGTMRALNSAQQMYNVLKAAYFAGINHIETAPVYGPAEEFLGEAIKHLQRDKIHPNDGWVITSKIIPDTKLEKGKEQLKKILKRLNISKIDNLAVHGLNLEKHLKWAIEGEGNYLFRWAKDKNLVKQIGFSSHGSVSLIEQAIKSSQFDFCSLHIHLLDQTRLPIANFALKQGMGVMAISPADKGGHLHRPSQILINDCQPIPPLELAYRFLLSNGITTLTVGASKVEDFLLPKKLSLADGPLSKLEKNIIKRLNKNLKKRLGNTYCGQCRACLPCPNSIPITDILRLRNLSIGHGLNGFAKERYNLINRAGHWWETVDGSACNQCGDCLPRCPYNLQIPNLLEETHQKLIDKPIRRLWD